MVYIKGIKIDRGRTIKITQRIGKKAVDTWDKIGVEIQWIFKESENPQDYKMFIDSQKKEIDNMIEMYSSQYFNEFNEKKLTKK